MPKKEVGFLLAVGFCCASCGGGGGGGNTQPAPGRYAGTYVGQFIDQSGSIGELVLKVKGINPETVSGEYVYPDRTVSFTGSITNGGFGNLLFQGGFDGTFMLGPSGQATTTLDLNPTQIIQLPSGGSTGSTGTTGGGSGSGNNTNYPDIALVALIANPTGVFGGANPFAGNYSGTIQTAVTSLGNPGVLALAINSAGKVSGSGVVDDNGTTTFTSISGTISKSGALSFVEQANQIMVTGTVSVANGTISGALKQGNGDTVNVSLSQVQPPATG